jgi:hypothetical protein
MNNKHCKLGVEKNGLVSAVSGESMGGYQGRAREDIRGEHGRISGYSKVREWERCVSKGPCTQSI